MSKIGKRIITIPSGMKVNMTGDNCTFSTATASQTVNVPHFLECKLENDILTVVPLRLRDKHMRAMWGTTRALLNNAVIGLSKGYEKNLEMKGLGYKAEVKGKTAELYLGYSHTVKFDIPSDVALKCPRATQIHVSGQDKQRVGQVAANLKALRKHNRYKDYGIYETGVWRFVKVRKGK